MRLKAFVISEDRSKPIALDEAMSIVESQCGDALNSFTKGNILYRGIDGKRQDTQALYIEPKKYTRESRNTTNTYTLVMDNAPKWRSYPKRSQSIICSTSEETARGFGFLFYVFPKDGAKYGVAPEEDLWWSFKPTVGVPLDDFNDAIEHWLSKNLLNIHDFADFKTYKDLIKKFKEVDNAIKKDSIDNLILADIWEPLINYNGDLLSLVQEVFDPKKNGFKVTKSLNGLPKNKEVWTDQPSVLIYDEAITKNWNKT
ncbi:MAG: hypothetical protein KAS32_09275 [Candidatus Peribacteraceae bacterium]|nr:hypothetical protein [Candidatus Peribacteraceae bacterium]